MSRDVSIVKVGLLEAIVEDVDDAEVELGDVADPRSTLQPARPLSFPVHEARVSGRREFFPWRIRRRQRVIAPNHLVPPLQELTHVFVVVSVDTVAIEDDRTILDELDRVRDVILDRRLVKQVHIVDGLARG